MAPRFLLKTALVPGHALRTADGLVLDGYARLREVLASRFGSSAGELLAEPIATWSSGTEDSSISWYTDLAGTPAPLSSLPPERRAAVERVLRDTLGRLQILMADASIGPMLRRALCVRLADSIWVVGEQPVLTEWGVRPDGAETGADEATMLATSPLGRFLPVSGGAPGAAPAPLAASVSLQSVPPPVVSLPPSARLPGAGRGAVPVVASASRSRAGWFVVPVAIAVAGLFLALGYWRGSVLASQRAAARDNTVTVLGDEAAARRALAQQNELNATLERQVEERRRLLEGNVCTIDPATMPRLGPDRAAVPAPTVVPPPPGGAPFQGTLTDLLKQGIVMVVGGTADGNSSIGTGFFITPDTILTNRHVIEQTTPGKLYVVNVKLGRPLAATVVASTPNSDIGSLDAALLRVVPPNGVQPLSFTTVAAELDMVIAAGYPALVTNADAAMQRLLEQGDMTAAPQLIMTDGRINAIQTSQAGVMIMPHGANVSAGNSGGPLVDGCGRVVGINTFVRSDARSAAHANFAQKTNSLLPFLKQNGAAVTEVGGPCAPGSPAAPALPAPSPAVPTPAAAPQAAVPGAPAQPGPATAPATPAR